MFAKNYTYEIKGNDEKETLAIAKAIQKLLKNIESGNLITIADKIESNPNLVQKALNYI